MLTKVTAEIYEIIMPRTYKLTSEARENLLKESQKWREEFSAIAKSKDPSAGVAKPLVNVVDGLCSTLHHALEQVEELHAKKDRLALGLEQTSEMAASSLTDLGVAQKKIETLEKDHGNTKRVANNTDRRCNRALNFVQQLQLDNSAKVIELRGIPMTLKKEGYLDLEAVFQQLMNYIRCIGIKPVYIRRMPQAGKDRRDPPAVKVTLLTIGDKIRIYNAFDSALREHKTLPFGISNEIPLYALGAYKHQLHIAAEVRAKYPGVKTRVGIARSAAWPVLCYGHK